MKHIITLMTVLAVCLLLLTASVFATDEFTDELPPADNTENTEEVLPDETSGGEAIVDETSNEADPVNETPIEDSPVIDGSSESKLTGWVKDDDCWYYYTSDGTLKTGWMYYNSNWYYLDPDQDGVMVSDTTMTIAEKDYFFDASGHMYKGWHKDEDGSWYYYDSHGAKSSGWMYYNSNWYYLDPDQDGVMVFDTTMTIAEKDYFFDASGHMYKGWHEDEDGSWYYYDSHGAKSSGWVYYSSYWYYLDPEQNNAMVSGTVMTINEEDYRFYSSGRMYTGWYKDTDGDWYYYESSGHMAKGWVKYNSNWYHMDDDGIMETGIIEASGNTYWLSSNGVMLKNRWNYYDDSWHYFTGYGRMAKGWIYLPGNGGNYYFYEDGSMAHDTTIDGITLNSSGYSTYLSSDMTTRIWGYSSPTEYLLVVNRSTCKFYIYKGEAYNWSLYDWSYCTCGAASTPTPSGTFYLGGGASYFNSGSCRCFYYRDITGNVAFHSVLYYQNGTTPYTATLMDSTIGARVSHGCIRLPLEQDLWVYNYAPSGSTVVIF